MQQKLKAFERLLTIMDELRENCPWDKKQTIESLRYLTIEETYELADAITENDTEGIKNELGDLLLHIVFYARIASETGDFNIKDVLDGICEKLIHRHPHIYGDVEVNSAEEVKHNWEQLKLKENRTSVLEGVPDALPAVVKANRLQDKVKAVGFDWEEPHQVWDKVQEELGELKKEVDDKAGAERIESEFGDVLFALINYARFIGVNPENALAKTNSRFMKRFRFLEKEVGKQGRTLKEMTLEEMDAIWEEAKKSAE